MVDYGIISLLVIQIALACICFFSWNSTKAEAIRMREAFLNVKDKVDACSRVVTGGAEKIAAITPRLDALEDAAEDMGKATRAALSAQKAAEGVVEEFETLERKINAKLAAQARWKKPPAEEHPPEGLTEEETAPEIPVEQIGLFQTGKNSTFGKAAV